MPFKIIRNDITLVKADAIVNTANPDPVIGGGTDKAIYEAAGKDLLLAERKKIGHIDPGEAASTPAFALKAKYIIHTVGPVWKGGSRGEVAILRSCYENSLYMARDLGCKSIAFPLIATGVYGFPRDKALDVASRAINTFVEKYDMKVTLVIFDKESFRISGKRFQEITTYIAQNKVDEVFEFEYDGRLGDSPDRELELRHIRERQAKYETVQLNKLQPDASTLDDVLSRKKPTFREKVLQYIEESGKTAPEIYNRYHIISKQTFSKLNTNESYKPDKKTAIQFCIALQLDLDRSLELLALAGYTLSESKDEDLIVKWYLANRNYSYPQINATLISYGFSPLYKAGK